MSLSLVKNQTVSLKKDAAAPELTKVQIGLGWDTKKGLFGQSGGNIDLDASCILFDSTKTIVDTIWFRQLQSRCGSVIHSGDNRTGEGDGDDETITVNLANLPANVESLVFTVNSFTGQSFSKVANAYCRFVNAENGIELSKLNLSASGNHQGMVLARVFKLNGVWSVTAIGVPGTGSTFEQMIPQIVANYL